MKENIFFSEFGVSFRTKNGEKHSFSVFSYFIWSCIPCISSNAFSATEQLCTVYTFMCALCEYDRVTNRHTDEKRREEETTRKKKRWTCEQHYDWHRQTRKNRTTFWYECVRCVCIRGHPIHTPAHVVLTRARGREWREKKKKTFCTNWRVVHTDFTCAIDVSLYMNIFSFVVCSCFVFVLDYFLSLIFHSGSHLVVYLYQHDSLIFTNNN